MNVVNVENLGFRVPEIAVFEVDQVPDSPREWSEAVGELDLRDVLGNLAVSTDLLVPHPKISYNMSRDPAEGKKRDWWAGDHLWHVDGTRFPDQPVLTVLGCQFAEEGSPTTDILDTSMLLEATIEDGFWARYGIDEKDLPTISSVFLDSTYQREAQPYLRKFMDKDERQMLDKIIRSDLEKAEVKSFTALLEKMDEENPAKKFPMVRETPLSGIDSLFLDGGGRNSRLIGRDNRDLTPVLHALRLEYLSDDIPHERGFAQSVGWTANRCVVFPQRGTLHRANPGNDQKRSLHIAALQQAA